MAEVSITFPERVRVARMLRGLSQGALAGRLNRAPNAVYRWEAGKSSPRPSSLSALARALEVRITWLFLGEGPMDSPPTTTKDPVAAESFDSSTSAR